MRRHTYRGQLSGSSAELRLQLAATPDGRCSQGPKKSSQERKSCSSPFPPMSWIPFTLWQCGRCLSPHWQTSSDLYLAPTDNVDLGNFCGHLILSLTLGLSIQTKDYITNGWLCSLYPTQGQSRHNCLWSNPTEEAGLGRAQSLEKGFRVWDVGRNV